MSDGKYKPIDIEDQYMDINGHKVQPSAVLPPYIRLSYLLVTIYHRKFTIIVKR